MRLFQVFVRKCRFRNSCENNAHALSWKKEKKTSPSSLWCDSRWSSTNSFCADICWVSSSNCWLSFHYLPRRCSASRWHNLINRRTVLGMPSRLIKIIKLFQFVSFPLPARSWWLNQKAIFECLSDVDMFVAAGLQIGYFFIRSTFEFARPVVPFFLNFLPLSRVC